MSWAHTLLILVSCAVAATPDSLYFHSREVKESNDILLSCGNESSGESPLEAFWRREDQHYNQELQLTMHAEMWHSFDGRLYLPGQAGASVILWNLTASDGGIYELTTDNISSTILLNINGSDELFVAGIPGEKVQLSCGGDNTMWHKHQKGHVQNITESSKFNINNGSLVIENLTEADGGWYFCCTKSKSRRILLWLQRREEGKSCTITSQPGAYVSLLCDESLARNWSNCSLILMKNGSNVLFTIRRTTKDQPWGFFLRQSVYLIVPSVTSGDAGMYFCKRGGQDYAVNLTVIPHAEWQEILGDRYWIIPAMAGGSLMFCLLFFLLYLQIRQKTKAKKKSQGDTLRSFFKISANGTLNQYANSPPSTSGEDPNSTVFHFKDNSLKIKDAGNVFYENVDRLATISRTETVVFFRETSEDEFYERPDNDKDSQISNDEFYERPDNDKDSQISNDGDCYENTPEEIKEDVTDNVLTDGPCYENTNEEIPIIGQGQINTDFMTFNHSCKESTKDMDRRSEKSTGSQSYEDMQGAIHISPVTALKPNSEKSLEDDADSYENMGCGNMDTSIYASPTSCKTLRTDINNTVAQSPQDYEQMKGNCNPSSNRENQREKAKLMKEDMNFNSQSPSVMMKSSSIKTDRTNGYEDMSVSHASPNLHRGSALQRKPASLGTK